MKPSKEKAKELVNKFYDKIKYIETSKDCASIAVNEIIKQLTPIEKAPNNKSAFLYWKDVKKEIKNL
jgi:hypothetical protein